MSKERKYFTGQCAVHILLYRDFEKKQVFYCSKCNANICEECRTRYDKRTRAAILNGWENFKQIFKELIK